MIGLAGNLHNTVLAINWATFLLNIIVTGQNLTKFLKKLQEYRFSGHCVGVCGTELSEFSGGNTSSLHFRRRCWRWCVVISTASCATNHHRRVRQTRSLSVAACSPHAPVTTQHSIAITYSSFVTPPRKGERSIVMSVSVCQCVFVCPRSYLRIYTSDLHRNLSACYLWPWLSPLRAGSDTVIRYVLLVLCMTIINAHKPRLLDVAAQLKRSAHATLGLAINCAQ